jgi:hypothetical protein
MKSPPLPGSPIISLFRFQFSTSHLHLPRQTALLLLLPLLPLLPLLLLPLHPLTLLLVTSCSPRIYLLPSLPPHWNEHYLLLLPPVAQTCCYPRLLHPCPTKESRNHYLPVLSRATGTRVQSHVTSCVRPQLMCCQTGSTTSHSHEAPLGPRVRTVGSRTIAERRHFNR